MFARLLPCPHPLSERATTCACARATERSIGRFTLKRNGMRHFNALQAIYRSVCPHKQQKNEIRHFCSSSCVLCATDPSIHRSIYPQKRNAAVFFCSCVVLCLVELCGGGMATICLERGGGARTRPRLPVAKVVEYFHFCRHDRLPSINYRKASERCIVAPNIPCYFVFAFLALAFSTFF